MNQSEREVHNLVPFYGSDIELIRSTIKGRGITFSFVSMKLGIPYSYFKKIIGGFVPLTERKKIELFSFLNLPLQSESTIEPKGSNRKDV